MKFITTLPLLLLFSTTMAGTLTTLQNNGNGLQPQNQPFNEGVLQSSGDAVLFYQGEQNQQFLVGGNSSANLPANGPIELVGGYFGGQGPGTLKAGDVEIQLGSAAVALNFQPNTGQLSLIVLSGTISLSTAGSPAQSVTGPALFSLSDTSATPKVTSPVTSATFSGQLPFGEIMPFQVTLVETARMALETKTALAPTSSYAQAMESFLQAIFGKSLEQFVRQADPLLPVMFSSPAPQTPDFLKNRLIDHTLVISNS